MKRPALLPGLILIGIGTFFLLRQLNVPFFENALSWPVILIVIGAAFIISSLAGWEKMLILPGGILFSLGIHFYGMYHFTFWPHHWSMYPGAVGVAFLLTFLRTMQAPFLIPAGILLALPTFSLFLGGIHVLTDWWPVALIIVGLYFIIMNRKS